MKGADEVLAVARIDSRLPADAGIDLGEKRGRDLDQAHAPAQARGAESSEVADHAAAERNDDVPPLDARLDQRVANTSEFGVALRGFAGRADDRRRAQSGSMEARAEPVEIERRDAGVGYDRAMDTGRDPCDLGPRRVEDTRP